MSKDRDRITIDVYPELWERVEKVERRYEVLRVPCPRWADVLRTALVSALDKQEAILSALETARRETAKKVRS